jgi:curved DNA-binding protein
VDYKDYYKILGVPRTATQAEVKKAFRKLAREHHPDLKPGDKAAERRFKDVNEANAVLSDPDKRKQYDTLGADWESYARAGAAGAASRGAAGDPFGGAGFGQGGNVRYEFRSAGDAGGFSDFFRTFFGGAAAGGAPPGGGTATDTAANRRTRGRADTGSFADILTEMGFDANGAAADPGGARGSGSRGGRAAGSVEATAEITLEEAFHGTARVVEIEGKRLEVTIPRGVDTGSRIRVSGRGGDGRDLYVVTKLRSHPVFTRKGADLERELVVTLKEALLGAEVPVTTLRGKVLLKIPSGTQAGRVFRLKGQGMPRLNGDGAGDLYVKVRVVLPASLTPEATTAAEQFLELVDQPDPRAGT